MANPFASARDYLIPSTDTFWSWQEAGEVIGFRDGPTIAFRGELLMVIQRLAPRGLPDLDAVLLLLAATRESWPESSHAHAGLSDRLSPSLQEQLRDVLINLDRLHLLEAELRQTPEAKADLAELVFDDSTRILTPEAADNVIEMLDGRMDDGITSFLRPDVTVWGPVLRQLLIGLKRVEADRLQTRRRSGLEELMDPADFDLPTSERVSALLTKLESDDELSGLARLARRLMAAVSLPRAVSDYDEMPLGGVSDISNRGTLDRLLLSELAHDDLTLAVRVAVNQALYLRRESPPRTPPRCRTLLLDAGIRTWGVPRVFAAAVALALAATTDKDTEVLAFRAEGKKVVPVDLATREGLVRHLESLELDLHPGAALAAFAQATSESGLANDPVLITTDDTAAAPEFRTALVAAEITPLHVATVNREGTFRLTVENSYGGKLLREAQLQLDQIFKQPASRPRQNLIDPSIAVDLPAIMTVQPFPLRLPHPIDSRRVMFLPSQGVALAISKDRRLMRWDQPHRGAQQVAHNLPGGRLFWWEAAADNVHVHAVVGQARKLILLRIFLDPEGCEQVALQPTYPCYYVCSHNGAIFAVSKHHVEAFTMTGERIDTLNLPARMNWTHGRFGQLRGSGSWFALNFDGTSTRLELVVANVAGETLSALFERTGVDGAIGVTDSGHLYFTATQSIRQVAHETERYRTVKEISHDGRFVVLQDRVQNSRSAVVDVETLQVEHYQHFSVDCRWQQIVRFRPLRSKISTVGFNANGNIVLVGRGGRQFELHYDGQRHMLLGEVECQLELVRQFQRTPLPAHLGYSLTVATWEDGSRAYYDTRGLLHLKSSDRQVPEVTIVLNDGQLSGWCSSGACCGVDSFVGDYPTIIHAEVFKGFLSSS